MNNKNKNFNKAVTDKINAIIMKHLENIRNIIIKQVKNVIWTKGAVASEELYNSIEGIISKNINEVTLTVFSTKREAVYTERGTKPHFPPTSAIKRWMSFKAGALYINPVDVENVAFLIARKISMKGTQAIKFFELGLKTSLPLIDKELKSVIK